jgi:hypothetical protein
VRPFTLTATLVVMLLFALTACSGGDTTTGIPNGTASVAPTWTPAQAPTATMIPAGSAATPTNVPAGWQVFAAPHLSIAYPPDWIVQIAPQQGGGTTYEFQSQVGSYRVQVSESDNVDSATAAAICSSGDQVVTFAGLPMRYSVGNGGRTLLWEFLASNSTDYQLQTADASSDPGVQAEDKSILSTFRAQYTTPGCS